MSMTAEVPSRLRRLRVAETEVDRAGRGHLKHKLGPLLAVCGLTGGAGATTLAYLVALSAAKQLCESALVADTGGPSGGIAAIAGVEAPRSLPELASHLAAGAQLRDGLYCAGPAGLRVLASGPEFASSCPHKQLAKILGDARDAHGLTVIDCGTLGREVDLSAAGAATHVAWVMPASEQGVSRGTRVLEAAPAMAAKEFLFARREVNQSKAPLRDLRRIAAERRAPLVLVPHLRSLERGRLASAVDEAQVAIQAILGGLRR
jgi:hypothetical protein